MSSNGTWSNTPLAYSYQWERCDLWGSKCEPIPGATNQGYTPVYSDEVHTLAAQVTAVNSGGSTTAVTAASNSIAFTGSPTYSSVFGSEGTGNAQFKAPLHLAVTQSGEELYVTDSANNRVQELHPNGEYIRQWGSVGTGQGQFKTPSGIALNAGGLNSEEVYVTDSGNNRVQTFTLTGSYAGTFGSEGTGNGQFKGPQDIASAMFERTDFPHVADGGNNRVEEFEQEGYFGTVYVTKFGSEGTSEGQFKEPKGIAVDGATNNVWVADTSNNRLEEFSSGGTFIRAAGSEGTGNGQLKKPQGVAVDPKGDVWVADTGNNRIEEFTASGVYMSKGGSVGTGNGQFKEPKGIVVDAKENIYVADTGNNRIQKWLPGTLPADSPPPAATPPNPGTSAVSTLVYNVPVSGTGAPYAMSSSEVAKWSQTDLPAEATAVYPPDETMGWPAKDYNRATIYYRDGNSRIVNVATPLGGMSTSEYNSYGDVVRSLTPDNRSAALKEGAKSSEVSKLLDTQSTYASEGTELTSTLGPQHNVKLASGTETLARQHTQYYYDEGAPEGGPYRLVTKMTEGAQIVEKPEADIRTAVTSYSGQANLGWILRKPTSVTGDSSGLKITHTTVYDPFTGNVTETRQPGASTEEPGYLWSGNLGSEGTGNGQFKGPDGMTSDGASVVWAVDHSNNRVEKFTGTTYSSAFGSAGTGNGQFTSPVGIAANLSASNLYVTDQGNNRVEEFSFEGTFVRAFGSAGTGNGQFKEPSGIAIDSSGNVYVADQGNNRIEKFTSEGTYSAQFGTAGTGNGQFKEPKGIAISGGNLYVVDAGNSRVQELSTSGSYIGQFGSSGAGNGQFTSPSFIATEPTSGNLYVADSGNGRIEAFTASRTFIEAFGSAGTGSGQFKEPMGIAFNAAGTLYAADYANNRLQMWVPSTAVIYETAFGSMGSNNGQIKKPGGASVDSEGYLWVADTENNRIEKFSSAGSYVSQFGTVGTANGQLKKPEDVAVDPEGNLWVTDTENNRVQEFSSAGSYVRKFGSPGTENGQFSSPSGIAYSPVNQRLYVVDRGNNRVQVYTLEGSFVEAFGSAGSGNGQLSAPEAIAIDAKGNVWVADTGNNRIQECSAAGAYVQKFGASGSGNGQFSKPEGVAVDFEGDVWVADAGNNRVQEFSAAGAYMLQYGTQGSGAGQITSPSAIAFTSGRSFYVIEPSVGKIKRIRKHGVHDVSSNGGAYGTQTIYYSAEANQKYSGCGLHPEYANLPCKVQPAAQPSGSLPKLPTTSYNTYNVLEEPLTVGESFDSTTRTTTNTYDAAGRSATTEMTATVGTSLPKVTNEYNSETGALVKQSTTVESKTKTIASVFNTLGQLTSYTDADENASTYNYDVDERVEKVNDGKGTQTYTYDTTSGALTKLVDSAAGTFTGTYDVEGNLTTEGYPNGMNANTKLDATSAMTGIEYVKTTHCTEKCTWYSDTVVPSIHGQWLSQSSTLSNQAYTYDNVGRLTQTQDTPTGKGCTTRIYGYDVETNRTSLTTREPGVGGACASEGGTTETHSYDSGDRLLDTGTSYDTFGNTAKLPAADAGGTELTSSYFVDNQLAGQTQNEQTIGYNLDPAGRTRETVSTGKVIATVTVHYAGPGASPAWSGETSGKWERNIPDINGNQTAIQHNGETPVLQLVNLHGDIVATAYLSETATELAATSDTTEFGVPRTSVPPKYSWLGGHELPTELPSGIVAMGLRSYIPQLGRFLQPDPVPGGSANAYTYTYGDPVNMSDLSGAVTLGEPLWAIQGSAKEAAEKAAIRAAEEAAAQAEAEAKAEAAAAAAAAYAGIGGEWEGNEEEYEEEEEGGAEYAAFGPEPGGMTQSHSPQPTQTSKGGVFFQELSGEGAADRRSTIPLAVVLLCLEQRVRSACAWYADFLGIGKAIKKGVKLIKKGVKWFVKAYKKVSKSFLRKISSAVKKVTYVYKCAKSIIKKERGYGGCDPLEYLGFHAEPAL
ncbi:MAG TPA: SMP-30/gluconolactonase/LRE family protein [Solirubrobacteraceae bacterium]|nr:SMP-30/gluconolactonase/LRE family protein [Solirubrobacteraceae bacterium]